jgi:hypothetical protein
VLEQVASGMAWESIIEEWRGSLSAGAIAEAVRTAGETFRMIESGQNGRRVAVL